jgi:tetratricopeptide (TPR) repeat protein
VLTVVLVGVLVSRRGGKADSLQQGVDAYTRGQREVAVNAFNKAVRENAHAALPHVYLARMAREVGNLTLASQELQLALEAEPANAIALREMGANLLTQGNYELARRFYVRAVQADPNDKTSQGYLGCTLMRLNRASEATSFLNRAGPGPWSNCTPVAPTAANGVVRP